MKLVHANGREAKIGDIVSSPSGTEYALTGWRPPHKPGSTGRVYVEGINGSAEYYPSVFNLTWLSDATIKAAITFTGDITSLNRNTVYALAEVLTAAGFRDLGAVGSFENGVKTLTMEFDNDQ